METTKQVILVTSNPQMLKIEFHGVGKDPARIFEVEWRDMIYTKRGQKV